MKESFFEQPESRTERLWAQYSAEVDHLVDSLGKEVDPNIRDTVTALRAMGFHTNASCEGHLDRGLKAPWVDFGIVPEDVEQAMKAVRAKHQATTPELTRRIQEIKQELLLERKKLLDLLDSFYENRAVSNFTRLTLDYGPNTVRLINQGVGIQDLYQPHQQTENLEVFRKEMSDFAEFLKARIGN